MKTAQTAMGSHCNAVRCSKIQINSSKFLYNPHVIGWVAAMWYIRMYGNVRRFTTVVGWDLMCWVCTCGWLLIVSVVVVVSTWSWFLATYWRFLTKFFHIKVPHVLVAKRQSLGQMTKNYPGVLTIKYMQCGVCISQEHKTCTNIYRWTHVHTILQCQPATMRSYESFREPDRLQRS